jgi:epoxide hydrolase 4
VGLAEASAKLFERGRLVRFPKATHWLQHEEPQTVTDHLLAHFRAAQQA